LSADGCASASKVEKRPKELKFFSILEIFSKEKNNFGYTLVGRETRTLDQK
jgi:hypothetical protein